ncbi:MAG: methionine--tRNA ligase [Methanomicrobiales archaeon]|nr:methionine--tRNA ligase [Methanomicrobiales archaeon]
MNRRAQLVTCGLPYTNGPCHIGHLRTYVPADYYVRFLRMCGEEMVFICGSDNHGTPIVVSAEEAKKSPREISEEFHHHFDATFRRMNIIFDHFGMTDDPTNHQRTKKIVESLIANGHVYAARIRQSFCTRCGRFLPDRYVEGICPHCESPARGDECDQGCGRHLEPGEIKEPTCLVCGTKAEFREQEHYFFRLSEFSKFLEAYLEGVAGTSNARNYALGWVKEGLRDWCITRTLEWGVKFPGREDLVVYVWVDAPIGYIAFTEEWAKKVGRSWREFWCGESTVTHFIGGDIIYHHAVFWPALLQGAGLAPSAAIVASGMVKIDDHKFSKSRGYVVWTNDDYLDQGFSPDYLRYYLLSYTNHTKELNFSWKVLAERVNHELVNTLGNFAYRTLHLATSGYGGVLSGEVDPAISHEIRRTIEEVTAAVKAYEFKEAVDRTMTLAAFGNTYIQTNAPWKLEKIDREAAKAVIRNCLQITKALALLVAPAMPDAAQRLWAMLGFEDEVFSHSLNEGLDPLPESQLPKPSPLFVKIEEKTLAERETLLQQRVEEAKKRGKKREVLTIEEFSKMDLRIGRVLSAEPVPRSSKLLVLKVDLGDEVRQIVSGIAQFYNPGEMVGRDVVVLANLQPARIFGIDSNGMILAAGDAASLLVPLREVPPGTKIR